MRRPALYIAGLFMATGAALAFAGPAAAADSGCKHKGSAAAHSHSYGAYADGDSDDWYPGHSYGDRFDLDYQRYDIDSNRQTTIGLVNLLSGNNGAGLIGGGF